MVSLEEAKEIFKITRNDDGTFSYNMDPQEAVEKISDMMADDVYQKVVEILKQEGVAT